MELQFWPIVVGVNNELMNPDWNRFVMDVVDRKDLNEIHFIQPHAEIICMRTLKELTIFIGKKKRLFYLHQRAQWSCSTDIIFILFFSVVLIDVLPSPRKAHFEGFFARHEFTWSISGTAQNWKLRRVSEQRAYWPNNIYLEKNDCFDSSKWFIPTDLQTTRHDFFDWLKLTRLHKSLIIKKRICSSRY